jgi:hypothetical protein
MITSLIDDVRALQTDTPAARPRDDSHLRTDLDAARRLSAPPDSIAAAVWLRTLGQLAAATIHDPAALAAAGDDLLQLGEMVQPAG